MSATMNDRLNAPVEPHDDGTVQEDPLYQEPSEGVVTNLRPSTPGEAPDLEAEDR